jgi:hypothetical protein
MHCTATLAQAERTVVLKSLTATVEQIISMYSSSTTLVHADLYPA